MAVRLSYSTATPEWRRAIKSMIDPIEPAAKKAVQQVATLARDLARSNINSAGFTPRWQKAMQFEMEKSPPDAVAAATVFHKIPFAVLFEEGGTIRGKPKLWLPIEANLPPGRWTPRKYVARFGPLVSVNHPGKPPMLFAKAKSVKLDAAATRRLSLRGVSASQESKPLFVGVDSVTLRKRFDIYKSIKIAADKLGEFYLLAIANEKKDDGNSN